MRTKLAAAFVVATTLVGCSDGALNEGSAAKLISEADGFQRDAHFWIYTDAPLRSAFRCLSQEEVARVPLNRFVVERGWVRYVPREAVVGVGTKQSCPAMALTSSGSAASAGWTRGRGDSTQGNAWAVPIGRRELVAVTKLADAPDGSTQVEFDWKWSANETGTSLRQSVPKADVFFGQTRKGRASCRRQNDAWRCALGMWMTPADGLGEFRS